MYKLTHLPPEIIIKIIEYHVEGLGISLFGNKLVILESIQSALLWERICKAFSNESLIRNYLTDNFWKKIILENFVRETIGLDSQTLKSTPRRKIIEHIKSKQDVKTLLVNYREFLKLITDFPHSISIYQRYFTRKDVLETFQIVVLGHHQAGKSQLVNSFLQIETNQLTSHNNEVYTRVEKHPMTPNQMFRMQVMDTHFLHTCSQHISQAHAILLVCSHCQLEETLFETEQILKRCIEIKQSSSFPLIVALNKSDESRKSLKKRRSNNDYNNNSSPSTPKSPTSNNCCHGSYLLADPFLSSPPPMSSSSSPSSTIFSSPPPICCFSAPIIAGNSLLLSNSYNNNSNCTQHLMNTSSATLSTIATTITTTAMSTSNISSSYNGTPTSLLLGSSSSFIQNNVGGGNSSTCCSHHQHHVRTEEDEYKMMENLLIRYGMINYRIIRTSGKERSNVVEAFDECVLRASLNHAKLMVDVIDAAVVHHVEATEKFFKAGMLQRKRCDLL